jgi:hypothetical protein
MPITVQALRRTFPTFDPTRLANWYGGIVRAIHAKGIDWASVPNLIARTLKGMEILTRQSRRVFLSKQIKKAIKSLCSKGVLLEYKPGRVRVHNQARFDKYLESKPEAWPESAVVEHMAEPEPENGGDSQGGSEIGNGDPELGQEPLPSAALWRGLPPLRVQGLTDSEVESEEAKASSHSDSESAALDRLLGDPQPPVQEEGTMQSAGTQSRGLDLDALRSALQAVLPEARVDVIGRGLRTKSGSEVVTVEARRDGSFRGAIAFPSNLLHALLKCVRASWSQLVVGEDAQGQQAVLRSWPAGVSAQVIVSSIMDDLQVLDDVRSGPSEL